MFGLSDQTPITLGQVFTLVAVVAWAVTVKTIAERALELAREAKSAVEQLRDVVVELKAVLERTSRRQPPGHDA